MLTLPDLVPLFFATIILALKPGPYMLALSSLAARGDLAALIFFWVGSILTISVMYFLVLSGLSIIPKDFGILFIFLKAIAAIIFVVMGLKAIQETEVFSDEEIEERAKKISARKAFSNITAGVTLGLSNPYDIIFVFTAVPSLLGLTVFSLHDIVLTRATVILADILVVSAYCAPLLILRKKIPPKFLYKVRVFCGVLMVGIGLFLMVNIISQFDLIRSNLIG